VLVLLGFFLIVTGMVWNIILLRGPASRHLTPPEILRTWPWMLSMALVVIGVLLLALGRG
jgi:hypothetical protein